MLPPPPADLSLITLQDPRRAQAGCARQPSAAEAVGWNQARNSTRIRRPFLLSQTSQLSLNFQNIGCLLLGFISALEKRVRVLAMPRTALNPAPSLSNLEREET